MITANVKDSRRNPAQGVWGKVLESVDPAQRGGFALTGPWIAKVGDCPQFTGPDGALVVFGARRNDETFFWLVRTGPGELEAGKANQFHGALDGTGEILAASTAAAEIVEAAKAVGVPVVEGPSVQIPTPARRGRAVGICGYTGNIRYNVSICEHCGDDC